MATQASNTTTGSTGSHDEASTTLGLGGITSGEAGATPGHETQQETGGSGGPQLTQSTGEIDRAPGQGAANPPAASESTAESTAQTRPEADGSALQSRSRGALDTRSRQAGGTGTGLGTPETGANQSQEDLPPPP
jgi:hypothetical protein